MEKILGAIIIGFFVILFFVLGYLVTIINLFTDMPYRYATV